MPGKPRGLLAGELGDFALEIVAAFLNAFAHFVTREAADRDLLAGLCDLLGDQLADGFLFFLDERLIQKHGLFEKLVEAAFDNLSITLSGLLRFFGSFFACSRAISRSLSKG